MTARPHEYRLQVGRTPYFGRCRIVERCIVNGAYGFPGSLVTQGEEVGKVIFAECGIVTLQPQNAPVPLCRCLACEQRRIRNGLYPFAVFFPLFVCLFLFRCNYLPLSQ